MSCLASSPLCNSSFVANVEVSTPLLALSATFSIASFKEVVPLISSLVDENPKFSSKPVELRILSIALEITSSLSLIDLCNFPTAVSNESFGFGSNSSLDNEDSVYPLDNLTLS